MIGNVQRGVDKAVKFIGGGDGRKVVLQNSDGSVEERVGGTASWRNNNSGNLTRPFIGSLEKGHETARETREQALAKAQNLYKGVIGLDDRGKMIFDSPENGDLAKATLLKRKYGNQTIEQILPQYAVTDGSGVANHAAYAKSIYKTGDDMGVDLRGKTPNQMSDQELVALQKGITKHEGYRAGSVATSIGMPNESKTYSLLNQTTVPSLSNKMVMPDIAPPPAIPKTEPSAAPLTQLSTQKQTPIVVHIDSGRVGQSVGDRTIAHVSSGSMGNNGWA
jgi:hypothetical protein